MGLFWTTAGNYRGEAAAFLNWATGVNKWVTFGQPETNTAAKRLPSAFRLFGCDAATFWHHWATDINWEY